MQKGWAVAAISVVAALWLTEGPTQGQGQAYRAPRLPGTERPNISGVWQAMNSANYDLQAHSARPALAVVPGPVLATPQGSVPESVNVPHAAVLALGAAGGVPAGLSVVEGGEIPYQPWAAKQKQENAENWLTRDPEIKCYLPGVPRATYMPYPLQIVQSTDKITILYEFTNANRTIHLDDVDPSPANSWMGQSTGQWEGDTLVVDVTSLNDATWFDRAGNFHSDSLHVIERYTPLSPHHLNYEATIEDPEVFTRPWKMTMPLYRRMEGNAQVFEYKCLEFVEELLYGHSREAPYNVVEDYEKWYRESRLDVQ